MKRFNLSYRWLLINSFIIIAIGIYIAFLKDTPFFILFNAIVDPVFWKSGIIDSASILFKGFIYSLLGVIMIVWGIQLFFITRFAFSKKEKWSWLCIFISVIVWFSVDESFSIYYGVFYNAIFNIPLLLSLMIPLLMTIDIIKNKNG